MLIANRLTVAIKAVCPIHGVSIYDRTDKATWRIDFKDEATQPERDAAAAQMAAFVIEETPDDVGGDAIEAIDRLVCAVLFDQENRLRVVEARLPITRNQFRLALIARWKVNNP